MIELERWEWPENYFGEDWSDYYVFLSQHRDSDYLERSNFEVGLKKLGGESETVFVVRAHHWAVGWIEWIAIHESDEYAQETAQSMLDALSVYPVLDDMHYSELEWSGQSDYWESLPMSERVAFCVDNGLSIFAARGVMPEEFLLT